MKPDIGDLLITVGCAAVTWWLYQRIGDWAVLMAGVLLVIVGVASALTSQERR